MKIHNIVLWVMILFLAYILAGCGANTPAAAPAPAIVPTITTITPASAAINTTVTITGTNFSSVAADNIVKFNGIQAVVASATVTTIVTTVPASATTGPLTITISGKTATWTKFTVLNTVQVIAKDRFGNVVTNYQGTIHFSSSDITALLPPDYTFQATDLGQAAFPVFFPSGGNQSLIVSDVATPTLIGTAKVGVK